MQNDFLPKGYKLPESGSSFFKFQDGENRIRILTKPVIGYEAWIDNKPVRREEVVCSFNPEDVDVDEKYSGKPKISLFWGFLVYNYNTKQVEVATITQKTVLKAIENLANDADWGSPLNYDISVNKVKNGERTTYSISPKPAKELSDEIKKAFEETDLSVNMIFGKSPLENDKQLKFEYPTEDSTEGAKAFEE
jgi:hypothetical protein